MGEAKRKKTAGLYLVKGTKETLMAMADRRLRAFEAAGKGYLASLRLLVRNKREADWKHPDCGLVLLDEAVRHGGPDIVRFLLDMGANPNALICNDQLVPWPTKVDDGMYFSPLATAIFEERVEELLMLLEAGADLDLPQCCFKHLDFCQTCRDSLGEDKQLTAKMEAIVLARQVAQARPGKLRRI